MQLYPRAASIYERRARLCVQVYESILGVLQRGARYYPYIEGTIATTIATIQEFGEGRHSLPIAFARRDEMGWKTGALRTDDDGYLYSLDQETAIHWLDTWISSIASPRPA